jgi:hypothetical protein
MKGENSNNVLAKAETPDLSANGIQKGQSLTSSRHPRLPRLLMHTCTHCVLSYCTSAHLHNAHLHNAQCTPAQCTPAHVHITLHSSLLPSSGLLFWIPVVIIP